MPQYIRPSELAKQLSVTRQAVYQWIKDGVIPEEYVLRIGTSVRVRADILDHFKTNQAAV